MKKTRRAAANRPLPADPKALARAMFCQADKRPGGGVKMGAQQRKKRVKKPEVPGPLDFPQRPLFIEHSLEGEVIPQRPRDGYI